MARDKRSLKDNPFQVMETVGRWTLLYKGRRWHGKMTRIIWLCRCLCLTIREVDQANLRNDYSRSCGCRWRERYPSREEAKQRRIMRHTWEQMIGRCSNPRNISYKNYGARGIQVCERWKQSFEAFRADVGDRPSPQHQLDRYPDNNGNYEPGNVRWATRQEQNRNMRTNVVLTWQGRSQTLMAWSEETGISHRTLRYRWREKWTDERILTTPVMSRAERARAGVLGRQARREGVQHA